MKQTAEEQIKELKQQLAMANEKIAQLTAIIKLQKNQIFGKKTEVMEPVVDGQQSLFSEQEQDICATRTFLITLYSSQW